MALWVALRSRAGPGYVELGKAAAFVPKASLAAPWISIPYREITRVQLASIRGQQLIIISSAAGEARIIPMAFASPSAFASFAATLQERVRAG